MSVEDVLKRLREEVAECRALSNIATDPEKRKLFETVAERLTELASAVRSELAVVPADAMRAAGQTPAKVVVVADAADSAVIQTTKSHRRRPWFAIVALVASAGTLVAAGGAFVKVSAEKDAVPPLEAKIIPSAAPEDTKRAIAEFQAAEENKRNLLSQQLEALAARVDNFETARAENLEKARAEIVEPVPKSDGERLRRPRHRKASSNSRTLRSGWGTAQWRF